MSMGRSLREFSREGDVSHKKGKETQSLPSRINKRQSVFCWFPSRWHCALRPCYRPLPPVHRVGLGCPIEGDRLRIATENLRHGGVGIQDDSCVAPIPILVIVVKPVPWTTGFSINKGRCEGFGVPIAFLHDAKLHTCWCPCAANNSRRREVPNDQSAPEYKRGDGGDNENFERPPHIAMV